MGDLANIPDIQDGINYSANDFEQFLRDLTLANDAVTTAKILNAAVTLAKLQDVGTATILGRSTAGTGPVEALTIAQVLALMANGNLSLGILSTNHLTLPPELGYATSGTIALGLNGRSLARILLTGNATFTLAGIAAGETLQLALKNNTGGAVTLAWPAWNATGSGLPASLAAGASLVVTIRAFGTTIGDCYASAS
jgi:hypothetical protein